jgi:hypothetical protein
MFKKTQFIHIKNEADGMEWIGWIWLRIGTRGMSVVNMLVPFSRASNSIMQ